jgi:hypothetical protein
MMIDRALLVNILTNQSAILAALAELMCGKPSDGTLSLIEKHLNETHTMLIRAKDERL